MEKVMDSFMNEYQSSFEQFFERRRQKMMKREDYKSLEDEKKALYDKFPKLVDYLQNENIVDLSNEEKQAVLQIIDIQEKIKIIEYREAFKLGGKEAYIFFEEQGMLNI